MTIIKSVDEILASNYDELTDEEYDHKQYLEELIFWGAYEPYQITPPDLAVLMRKYNIISEEELIGFNATNEDENRLKKVLEENWDSLDEYERAVFHAFNKTLPTWGKPYPPTDEYMRSLQEIINKHPKFCHRVHE